MHNPWKRGWTAGGSSSGSAALVAAGEVDMAIAGDQGGSIRIPSSNCGVCGMKPTHGLVPYTGIVPIEQTLDCVGPVTATVADNALFLEVLAGEDGLDPRQYGPRIHRYTEVLGRGCAGLRIGVLKEGFHRPESEADVDRKVLDAAERFRGLGAHVREVSVEEHLFALDLWTAIAVEGLQNLMMRGNGSGTNYRGLFLPSMIDRVATWRHRADELSHSLKTCMFLGEHFQDACRGRYYGKAQNLVRHVTRKYLEALEEVDLLLMPTVPMKAQPIPPADCSTALYVQRAFEMVGNTAPFNAAGLPAMSIPCGLAEGHAHRHDAGRPPLRGNGDLPGGTRPSSRAPTGAPGDGGRQPPPTLRNTSATGRFRRRSGRPRGASRRFHESAETVEWRQMCRFSPKAWPGSLQGR